MGMFELYAILYRNPAVFPRRSDGNNPAVPGRGEQGSVGALIQRAGARRQGQQHPVCSECRLRRPRDGADWPLGPTLNRGHVTSPHLGGVSAQDLKRERAS